VFRIQILGPVRAWRAGDLLDPGPATRRAVLGLLALAGGQPLPRDEIIGGIWYGRRPPPSAANVIQTQVKNLRRLLEPHRPPRGRSAVLRQVGDGYALQVPVLAVDLGQFRRQVAAAAGAHRAGRLEHAVELFAEALGRWQGAPLADAPMLAAHPRVVALAAERQAALGRYGELLIAAGRAVDALPVLEEAAAAQPMDEAGQARLIRAYQAAGRRGQAFASYHAAQRRLADELGVAPGADLAAAHAALLRGVGAGGGGAAQPAPEPPDAVAVPLPAPAQLPADLAEFVGRAAELDLLDQVLAEVDRPAGAPRPPPVCVVSGTAGVGKSALAVHWAHRVIPHFPDGQLYVNLRGFDPGGVVTEPAEAVRRFLDAIEVPADRIPADLAAQVALYRAQLTGRRMLVVLDNARDAGQARPLLPGVPGCLVILTSRNQIADLIGGAGTRAVPLDPLPTRDAHELLTRRFGRQRAASEPHAVAEILARCAGLPLALAIVAARAVTSRSLPLAALASQLHRGDQLDALTTGDPLTDLRAVFSWSYRQLTPPAARLFRLLGLHPGPDISNPAAASLAGATPAGARALLAELARANLVTVDAAGRYALHDLLRAYATEVAEETDPEPERRTATDRMFDHYLHSAFAADGLLRPERSQITLAPPGRGVTPERYADHQRAFAWFAAERSVLLGAVDHAAGTGRDTHTWQLAWALATYLDRGGHWTNLAATQRAAVTAAGRAGAGTGQVHAHRYLARAYTRLGRLDAAHTHLHHALDLCRRDGNRSERGHTHLNLALLWDRRGRYLDALAHARQALELFHVGGDRQGQARACNAVGWYHALLGDHHRALAYCQRALAQLTALGDRNGEAATLDSLGYIHHCLGHHVRSVECYERAVNLYRDLGDRHLAGMVLSHLGDAQAGGGNAGAARAAWRRALGILDGLDRTEAGRVRARMAAAARAAPTAAVASPAVASPAVASPAVANEGQVP
jgi:DNA-binding SARP family transcriptional activator